MLSFLNTYVIHIYIRIHKNMHLCKLEIHLVTSIWSSSPSNKYWLAVQAIGLQKAHSPALPPHPQGEVNIWTIFATPGFAPASPLKPWDSLHSLFRMLKSLDGLHFKAVTLNQGWFSPPGDKAWRCLGVVITWGRGCDWHVPGRGPERC